MASPSNRSSLPFRATCHSFIACIPCFLKIPYTPNPTSHPSLSISIPIQETPTANTRNTEMADVAVQALKAVTLTHVRYRRGDALGHLLAWISLVPVFISLTGFVSHFLFRRELQGLCFALGIFLSQIINELVKSSFQQSRPETCAALEACDSHGWPSAHSQYMFFFSIYLTLMSTRRPGVSRLLLAIFPWPLAFLTLYSRVYLGYHSIAQVFAGAVLGLVLGVGWFWVVNSILVEYFPAVEESAIGRYLYIKDSSHIPDVLKFEYDNARATRKKLAKD